MEKILVTGCAGYVGSILVRHLLEQGYFVRGLDNLMYGDAGIKELYHHPQFEFIRGDIADQTMTERASHGVYGVLHLAAVVGDPACASNPALAQQTNGEYAKRLVDQLRHTGIERFVFASTCSNYGKMKAEEYVTEKSPLRPVSLYAKLKVQFEDYLLNSSVDSIFTPTSLRFATVYGLSPRMRFDLTVNEFTREAALGRELVVFGEQFWRPYCHVIDIARACALALSAPRKAVDHEVFNAGNTLENYQKQMIVEILKEMIPNMKVRYVHKDEDPRDYKVDFSKIKKVLGFQTTKTVRDGVKEIYEHIQHSIV